MSARDDYWYPICGGDIDTEQYETMCDEIDRHYVAATGDTRSRSEIEREERRSAASPPLNTSDPGDTTEEDSH